jgi:hypothetical protein
VGSPATPSGNILSISLLPGTQTVQVNNYGSTIQYLASGDFDNGSKGLLTASSTWNSSNPAVATVSSQGLVTIAGHGTTILTASYEGVAGTATFTVESPQLVSIEVVPESAIVDVGTAIQFVALGTFSNGGQKTLNNVTWTSSHPAVAPISSSGLATGTKAGTTTIEAQSSSLQASATLTVQN